MNAIVARQSSAIDVDIASRVAISYQTAAQYSKAAALAQTLHLPLCKSQRSRYEFYLTVTESRLELRQSGRSPLGPVYIDFSTGKAAHRRRFGGGRSQTIAKAVGIKPGFTPSIIDATAGLGYDAFVLASLGCRVTMIERSTTVAALLQDALDRAQDDTDIGNWVSEGLHLIVTDSCDYLATSSLRADVVYLDPMYPQRSKSALVKKDMQILQKLLAQEENQDPGTLLTAALNYAPKRVVVKRPRPAAPILPYPEVNFCIESKTTRFDIYLC